MSSGALSAVWYARRERGRLIAWVLATLPSCGSAERATATVVCSPRYMANTGTTFFGTPLVEPPSANDELARDHNRTCVVPGDVLVVAFAVAAAFERRATRAAHTE